MTNRELAYQLNLSPAALSLILNNKPGVSDATRKRVITKLQEMGYEHLLNKHHFRETASAVSSASEENQICFAIYKRHGKILNQHPFFMLLMESIEECARKHGYSILLSTIQHNHPINDQIVELNKKNIQGVILFATEMLPEDLQAFEKLRVPYVALDNDFTRIPVNSIAIDNAMGTYQAIKYLVTMGHKQIGYLQSDDSISSFEERSAGYREALAEFNLNLNPEFIFKIPYSEEGSYLAFQKILQKSPSLPTAFVSDDDTIAVGVMRALNEAGFTVPNDISIIGFNDRPSCTLTSPTLTSINVPRFSFGAEAVDALLKQLEYIDQNMPINRSLKLRIGTELVIRKSVKKL